MNKPAWDTVDSRSDDTLQLMCSRDMRVLMAAGEGYHHSFLVQRRVRYDTKVTTPDKIADELVNWYRQTLCNTLEQNSGGNRVDASGACVVAMRWTGSPSQRIAMSVYVSNSGDTDVGLVLLEIYDVSRKAAEERLEALCKLVPKPSKRDAGDHSLILFHFVMRGAKTGKASSMPRKISCPDWDTIRENYTDDVQRKIGRILSIQDMSQHGKILILHGPAGTGKTHVVRALARRWADVDYPIDYVLDSERFFADAQYLYSLALKANRDSTIVHVSGGGTLSEAMMTHGIEEARAKSKAKNARPRIVIVEDSADLFSTSCRTTPGFARFLNLTDGIIGQGIPMIFVLTANEELGTIDEAVQRPGRCIDIINIPALGPDQAGAWLRKRGSIDMHASGNMTLAQLYAQLGGRSLGKDKASIGFGK